MFLCVMDCSKVSDGCTVAQCLVALPIAWSQTVYQLEGDAQSFS